MDVQSIIEQAGGVRELAARLRVARTTVLDWRRSGLIPGSRLARISREFNIPADDLLDLAASRKGEGA